MAYDQSTFKADVFHGSVELQARDKLREIHAD